MNKSMNDRMDAYFNPDVRFKRVNDDHYEVETLNATGRWTFKVLGLSNDVLTLPVGEVADKFYNKLQAHGCTIERIDEWRPA